MFLYSLIVGLFFVQLSAMDTTHTSEGEQGVDGCSNEFYRLTISPGTDDGKEWPSSNLHEYSVGSTSPTIISAGDAREEKSVSWRTVAEKKGHKDAVVGLALVKNGKKLFSCSLDGKTFLWSKKGSLEFLNVDGYITALAATSDSDKFAYVGRNKTICLRHLSAQSTWAFTGHTMAVETLAMNKQGNLVASGSHDCTVRLWEPSFLAKKVVFDKHTRNVASVIFSPCQPVLASGSHDKTVRLWDIEAKTEIANYDDHEHEVSSVTFEDEGRILASGSFRDPKSTVYLWDKVSGKKIRTLHGNTSDADFSHAVAVVFQPNTKTLFSGHGDGVIRIWDIAEGKQLDELCGHTNAVSSLAFSEEGAVLASGSWDTTIRVWRQD